MTIDTAALAGQYLTFGLDGGTYGIGILSVRELIGLQDITRVPDTPPHVCGLINLRGRVITVASLRAFFGMPTIEPGPQSVIIVAHRSTDDQTCEIGLLVDEVLEVADVIDSTIEAPDSVVGSAASGSLRAVGRVRDDIVFLLHSDSVLDAIAPTDGMK